MGELEKVGEFQLVDYRTVQQNIAENFEGLTPQFISVKVPSGGATTFEIDEEPSKVIEGILIDHYAIRALFFQKYEESDNKVPDCRSMDGKTGEGICTDYPSKTNKRVCYCPDCPMNEWGSFKEYIDNDEPTNKKACQERHRLFILRSGELLPILINLPVTSIKPLALYMTKLASKGKSYQTVITRITLDKMRSGGGLDYAQAVFTRAGDIPEDKKKELIELSRFLKPYCRQKPVEADDTYEAPSSEEEPF